MIKLLLALGAVISVWALERESDAASVTFKHLLMDLSGRQTKRIHRMTTSGLLTGLWVFQMALEKLACYTIEQLNAMMENHLPSSFVHNNG